MATINGRDGVVKAAAADTSDFTAATTVGEVVSYSIEVSINLIDDTELDDTWTTNQDGVKSWSASVEAFFDAADSGQDLLALGNNIALFISPGDSNTEHFYGNARINSISRSADNSSMVKVSFSATGNGILNHVTP